MKKIIFIIALAISSKVSHTQIVVALLFGDKLNTGKLEFGLVVTPSLTNISGIDSKSRPGLNIGIYFNIRPDRNLFLHVEGIGKGSFGAKDIPPYPTQNDTLDNLFASGTVQRNIQSFSLPVLLRYRISGHFFADAGIQADLMLKGKDVFKTDVSDNKLEYTIPVTKQLTRLDFGVTGGFYYKFTNDVKSMGVGVRYFYGLTDTHKTTSGTQANLAWLFSITIPIGTGKPVPTDTE